MDLLTEAVAYKAVRLLPCIWRPGSYFLELANHTAIRSPWDLRPICCAKTASLQMPRSIRGHCVLPSELEHCPSLSAAVALFEEMKFAQHRPRAAVCGALCRER